MDLFNQSGLALGWTLIHMTWITLGIALLVQVARLVIKNPNFKYRIGIGSMLALPIIAIFIFSNLFEANQSILIAEQLSESLTFSTITGNSESSGSVTFSMWIEQHMDWIVILWFAGMISFAIRLLFGFSALTRLRKSLIPLSEFWTDKFWRLTIEFQINRKVILGGSKLIASPITFGFLKPAILLPIGMVNALSVDEVEAILRHELAHIARYDYIFKMLQSAVESLFYYSPGTWWLSKMTDIDREQCCDDYAIRSGSNPSAYINALYKVNTYNTLDSQLALGFGKEKNQLLYRVNRILKQPQEKINIMGRLVIPIILLLVVAAVSINATLKQNEIIEPEIEQVVASEEMETNPKSVLTMINDFVGVEQDTTTKPKSKSKNTSKTTVNGTGKSYSVTREDGKIKEMIVDGKKIDPADYHKYESEYGRHRNEFHFNGDGPFTEEQMKEFEERMEEFGNSFEHFGKDNEEWQKRMEKFGLEMEEWGNQFEMDEEQLREYEERMSEWGERFGSTFGDQMAEWGERFGERFANGFHFDFDTEGMEQWGEELEEKIEQYRKEHPEDFYQDEEGEWHLKKDNLTDEEAEEIFGEGWIDDLMSNTMELMNGFEFHFDNEDFEMPPMPKMAPMPPFPGIAPYEGAQPFKLELKAFKAQLTQDGHFKNSGKADIKMDENSLSINGKVQDRKTYKKYAEIIKRDWGEEYLEEYEIDFTIVDKDSKAKKKIKGTYRI